MSKIIPIKCTGAINLKLSDIHEFQGELKTLSKDRYEQLKKSILTLGFSFPENVWLDPEDKKYKILDGHQRFRTVKQMAKEGYAVDKLPCNLVEADNKKQAKQKLLAAASQYGEVTSEGLYEFINEADLKIEDVVADFNFPEIDFEEFEEEFFDNDGAGLNGADEDDIPNQVPAKTKLGDLYQLGNHRLLCGDSTDIKTVEKLMNGQKADMVFTDPPYGIGYENTMGGIMGDGSLDVFKGTCSLIPSFVNPKTHAYIFFGIQLASESLAILNGIFKQYNILVMPITHQNKPGPEGYFNSNYEICYFTNIDGVKKHYSGAGSVSESTLNDPRYKGSGFLERYRALNEHVITEHNLKTVHPTEKKVSGIEFYLSISSKQGELVLDLFGGSGSTLIACEKTKRKCFMMELDPHYCDVIVARWEKFTGKKAKLIK